MCTDADAGAARQEALMRAAGRLAPAKHTDDFGTGRAPRRVALQALTGSHGQSLPLLW